MLIVLGVPAMLLAPVLLPLVFILLAICVIGGIVFVPLYGLYLAIYGRPRRGGMPDGQGPHEPPGA